MKAVVAMKNRARRMRLKIFLDEAFPNSTVLFFDDVMMAARHIVESQADVFFADAEARRFVHMLKKSGDGMAIVLCSQNHSQETEMMEAGVKSVLVEPITKEKVVGAVEGLVG
ncbi:MAG: hypothetical protein IJ679_00090 [Lachnospiraceae bacterium]|nr:hypothetical protein [Lachnospiraceae bacterium]